MMRRSTERLLNRHHSSPMAFVYLFLAVVGLAWPLAYALKGVNPGDMLTGAFATPSVSLLTADLLVATVAAIVWVVVEARRLGLRWLLYLVAACVAPISVVLPFFLYRRERVKAGASD